MGNENSTTAGAKKNKDKQGGQMDISSSSSAGTPPSNSAVVGKDTKKTANKVSAPAPTGAGNVLNTETTLKTGTTATTPHDNTTSTKVTHTTAPATPAPTKPAAAAVPKYEPSGGGTFDQQAQVSPQNTPQRTDIAVVTDALTDVRVRYHINPKEIGHGHYGVVRKCMDRKTKEWYAIKSIRKAKVGRVDVLKREIDILKEVNHPNIIRLVEVHEDEKYLHLITELCTGGELFDRIIAKTESPEGHFSEIDAANIVRCILDAIAYCHDVKGIVHRDLKPENFLFKDSTENAPIKIIDFGLSRHDTQVGTMMKTKVGTPYYVAPEVLNREYTKSCDIWSIGVITYILLCGYPPFYGDSDNQIFESVRAGKFDFPSPEWDTISAAAKDFIRCLLKKDPYKRLTASQALHHKWIQDMTMTNSHKRSIGLDSRVRHGSVRSETFKNFLGVQKLKKAALGYIVTHLTTSEMETLGEIFTKIDKNGDGYMTLQDLDYALTHGDFSLELVTKLKDLREDLSLSGDEKVNWKDFLAAMTDKSLLMQEENIKLAFEHFKKADNKCLHWSDLVEILGGEAQAKEIIGDHDKDGDGLISFEEFRAMMAISLSDGE